MDCFIYFEIYAYARETNNFLFYPADKFLPLASFLGQVCFAMKSYTSSGGSPGR